MNICSYSPVNPLNIKEVNDRFRLLFKEVCYLKSHVTISSTSYANDAAAAAAGIPVGGIYQTSGALKVRLV